MFEELDLENDFELFGYDSIGFDEIIEEILVIQENQILLNNNLVDLAQIFVICIGLFVGLILGGLFVKVVFHGT